jgi:pimeloyl-ACP methyl ester carboxylesterase
MVGEGRGGAVGRRDGPRGACSGCGSLAAAVVLLLAALLPVTPAASAVRFKTTGEATLGGADALAGIPEACEAGQAHVWVEVEGRGECIAFHATPGLETAASAVLYFEGDIPPGHRRDTARLKQHLAALRRHLAELAARYRIPYVLVARPGTFGSTGDHDARRKEREYLVMRAAVDAIRSKLGLDHVVLAGQSGGATVTGGLLALGVRHVSCAVAASGGFDLTAMLDWHAQRQGAASRHREHPASLAGVFNVMDRVSDVPRDARRRVFIVGDSADQVTPFAQQRAFAERLRAEGHHAEVLYGRGNGPERHGLAAVALKLAGLCARGASDADIRAAARAP